MHPFTKALFAVVPPLAAGAVGGLAARDAKEIYVELHKPSWAAPAQVFGPVWSALYSLIGVVGWRLAARPRPSSAALHLTQLGLNAAWTPLFFGSGRRRAALGVSVLLDLAIAGEMVALKRQGDRASAGLLFPYLAWSAYATALTANVSDPPS
jgi:tryptophan-rich sensory protein